MDSDLADWSAWDDIRDSCTTTAEFHACISVYLFLYAKLAEKYVDPDQTTLTINRKNLARRCRVVERKLDRYLTVVGRALDFEYTTVGRSLDVMYPNFLKKQKLDKRYGSGRYGKKTPKT